MKERQQQQQRINSHHISCLESKNFTNSADTAGGGTAFRCTASWTRIHSRTAQLTLARLETEDAELEQPGGVVLMPPDRPRERPERKL
ncbi:uncharacterized protein LOC112348442 isoform X2 [Selaginella moellendorffii]|uniref:uncharacterized protein LOC112348442 isoform X2 n=1 Tax=Selaginella moellendorffii TaxID=88036 RepID=UPI000D1D0077|nr:uncharacterized protein LOC112348442 isoform X2 [Selaginella moellendorffii]|eukprot:XP_024536684.1 uncharacterized protein LOC112348442 isoform X2 [Selaginella moellendorffii]